MNSLKIQAPVMDERGMVKRSGSEITLSQAWKDDILALHNTARSGVSPSPVNALPTLVSFFSSKFKQVIFSWDDDDDDDNDDDDADVLFAPTRSF